MSWVATGRGSWLDGPGQNPGTVPSFPGERIGLPPTGPRSVAGFGRRLGAIIVDWLIAALITGAITARPMFNPDPTKPWLTPGIFAIEYVVLVSLIGRTIGMRLFGVAIMRLDGRRVPLLAVVTRTVLLLLFVPAVIYDRDQRGLHDKAAGSVAVRL